MPMAVGTIGIDSANPVDPIAAHKAGSRFQVRYSAGAATNPNHASYDKNSYKLCRVGEIASIVKSGQDFHANDEWYTDRMLGGAAAAEEDAPATLAFWRARGYAKGASISLNHDTGLDMRDISKLIAYFKRYHQILGGEYLADKFYGPLPAARALAHEGLIKHFWIPEGASFFTSNVALTNPPPPAKTAWNLWAPTSTQVSYAIHWLLDRIGDDVKLFKSIVWQDLNHMLNGAADQNIVLKGEMMGSHLDYKLSTLEDDMYDAAAEKRLMDHIDAEIKQVVPRALLMVLTGEGNGVYTDEDMKGTAGGGLLNFGGFAQNPLYGQMLTLLGAVKAVGVQAGITPAQMKQIIQDALEANVVAVDINVHGTATQNP